MTSKTFKDSASMTIWTQNHAQKHLMHKIKESLRREKRNLDNASVSFTSKMLHKHKFKLLRSYVCIICIISLLINAFLRYYEILHCKSYSNILIEQSHCVHNNRFYTFKSMLSTLHRHRYKWHKVYDSSSSYCDIS